MSKKILFSLAGLLFVLLALPTMAKAAKLAVDPSSKSVTVGESFSLNIKLDTEAQPVDGVDVHYLNYDKDKLEVVGSTITAGTLFSSTPVNSVDATNGRIDFSQAASGGTTYNGSGTLATINLKAKATGTAQLTFNYTAGSTIDSNVASVGSDLLNGVTNGTVSIAEASTSTSSSSSSATSGQTSSQASSDSGLKVTSSSTAGDTTTTATAAKKLVSTGPATTILLVLTIVIVAFVIGYLYLRKDFLKEIQIGKTSKKE